MSVPCHKYFIQCSPNFCEDAERPYFLLKSNLMTEKISMVKPLGDILPISGTCLQAFKKDQKSGLTGHMIGFSSYPGKESDKSNVINSSKS
jgi:hypothetical protein